MGKCATKNRAFALGGEIDKYGNDLTQASKYKEMSATGTGGSGIVGQSIDPHAGMSQGIAGGWDMTASSRSRVPIDTNAAQPAQQQTQAQPPQTALGMAAPQGQGAGATYGWSVKTMAEQAASNGIDPHAGVPIYDGQGRVKNPSRARSPQQEAPPADTYREPAQNTMTPVDSLFPPKLAFAGGGIIGGAVDGLRGTAKRIDDAENAAVNAPAPQAVAQPAAKVSMGSEADSYAAQAAKLEAEQLAASKARVAAIPKKKNIFGFAEGGKIKGPGTPTSDSIPAKVRETGEPIAVSTDERIVSKAQGRYLEAVAKGLGHTSLDAMLEAGTGKPVGPTIKGGVKHAATGFASVQTQAEVDQATAARKQADIEAAAIQKENQRGFASAPTSSESKPLVGLPVVEKPALANLLFSSRPEPQKPPIAQPIAQQEAPAIANPVATPTPTPAPTPAKTLSQVAQGGITIGDQGDGQYQYDRDPRFAANKQQVAMPSGAAQGNNLADATQMQAPQGGGYITNKAGKSMSLPGGDTPYVGIDGKPTGEWNKTQAYADAITRNERDKVRLSEMERDRYKRDMGPDIKDNRTIALAKLNLDRMDKDRAQQIDQTREDRRTGIAEEDSRRGAARFTLEQKLADMQLEDAGMIRSARNELNLALASGDRAKIEAAKNKAVAAGIKFDKPAETFKFIPNPMGGGVLVNEASGEGEMYNGDWKKAGSISPPGRVQAAPPEALEDLRKNPQTAALFKAQFGYLPEGK